MEKELMQIQQGTYAEDIISPREAMLLAEQWHIKLPENSVTSSHRNLNKEEWNRHIDEDFSDFDIVRHCVLNCLAGYRVEDQERNKAGMLYINVLKLPYESMFERANIVIVRDTLIEWNMNTRGAKLEKEDRFIELIQNVKPIFDQLNQYTLLDFINESKCKEIEKLLCELYRTLKISINNPFVTTSKTLHFYMPQLFIPIDRTYTVNYFTNYRGADLPNKENKKDLVKWAISFHKLLAQLYYRFEEDFNELSTQTKIPVTKLLDDVLIGFAIYRRSYCAKFDPHKYIKILT